ncbi:GFA family protein [Falsiroseomonas sp. HW251]|uniref:GFA family protein n=1 Tax=Falsiroseomonas sp. HW251 TaxID=3390998 RepID=UPI003D315ABE
MTIHAGGCICGAIRYETEGAPLRVTVCHCRWCQRATGTAYMVEPVFDLAAFRVTEGEPATYDHRSEGSGKLVHVHFCPRCGTKLFLTFERFPGAAGIYAGTFDEPDWIEVRPSEANHLFCEVARPDTLLPEGTRAFPGHARAQDGALNEPRLVETAMPARRVFG